MISLRSLITIACVCAGFANSYRAFSLLDEDTYFASLHFAVSAGWMLIVARKLTGKKAPQDDGP